MEINATVIFEKNYDALLSGKRFIVNQGGARSSKTWSLCQMIIVYALSNKNKLISIVRKTFPALRATVMRDFIDVLKELNLYNRNSHNKSESIYTFSNGTQVEFFSTDDEQKLRGRKRDICWANEANELMHDDFLQLNMRTLDNIIVDYNPSDADCWIYELDPEDVVTIKSTYKDNPFLQESIIKQIEGLKDKDQALYQIYALGERSMSRKNIYSEWNFHDKKPDYFVDYIYGLDFGYNHPTALMKVYYFEDEIFIETIIYESYLTTTDLINKMNDLKVDTINEIMCDYSRPEIIQEMRDHNFNTQNANKSVKDGINNVKQFKINCLDSDEYIKKEYRNYMWKKSGDRILDEPVKSYDDAMDAIRYAVYQIKDLYYNSGSPLLSF